MTETTERLVEIFRAKTDPARDPDAAIRDQLRRFLGLYLEYKGTDGGTLAEGKEWLVEVLQENPLHLVLCHPCSDVFGADLLLRGIAVGGGSEEAVPGDVDGGGARGARSHDLAGQSSRAPAGTRAGAAASGRVRRRTGLDGYPNCRSRAGQCAHDWAGAAALCRGRAGGGAAAPAEPTGLRAQAGRRAGGEAAGSGLLGAA